MKSVTIEDAVDMIPHGASVMIGGFMGVGTPSGSLTSSHAQGKLDLLVVANDTAAPSRGIGKLVSAGLISRTTATSASTRRRSG